MKKTILKILFCMCAILYASISTTSNAQQSRITKLSDISFGSINNFSIDYINNQNVCAASNAASGLYRLTATGSGSGNSFLLSSGSNTLAYEVQWSDAPDQTVGQLLTSGVPLTGQHANATQQSCDSGPPVTASLIVILRATALSNAAAGSYAGTLTLLMAPN